MGNPNPKTDHLIPFKPGDDPRRNTRGNYNGVPHSKTRLLKILSLLQKKENPITKEEEELSVAEQMDLQMIARALNGDVKAYKEVIDRLEGTPTQNVKQEIIEQPLFPIDPSESSEEKKDEQ